MADINAFSNAQLSREMYTALFKNTQAYYLVGEILADGKVNPNSGNKDGQSDAAALGKLRDHLEAAAKAGHSKLTPQDKALLNALDASSRDGASADVVYANLRKIQDLQKQVAEKGLDPTQVSFELRTQTHAEKLQGDSHALTVGPDAHASEAGADAGGVCKVTPGAAVAGPIDLSLPVSADCENNMQEEIARQHLISPIRVAQGQAVKDLGHAAEAQMALLKKPALTPDAKLKQDLVGRLAGLVDGDRAYVKQALDSVGLKESDLTKRGVLKAGDPDGLNNQRLKDFLASEAFEKALTPAAMNGYRKLLTDTLAAYAKDPSDAHFDQLREVIYDHSYVFETADGVGPEAVADYARMKEQILNVSQQSNLLQKVTQPANLPASMGELSSDLRSAARSADSDAQRLAGQIGRMLDQIEAHPELFAKSDVAGLRAELDTLVKRDDKGQPTGLKVSPPGQEQLNTLNRIWSQAESIGLQAGLGDEFSKSGAIAKALDQAIARDPQAAEDPAVKLLKAAPELSEYSDLLSHLSKPENKPLLEAMLNNRGPEVSKFFSEYYSGYFDFSAMLGSLGKGVGTALALGGGLVGGAVNLGLSLGKSLFGGAKSTDSTAATPNGLSFANFQLNLPGLTPGKAEPAELKQSTDPSGKQMRLAGVSQTDVEAVMKLLATKPEARALLTQHGADLNQLLKASPAGAEIRTALDAKQAFDGAFWANSSSLEDAQASIQGAMAAQTNARISLTQAGLAVKSALDSKTLEPEARQLLEGQQSQIEAALKAIETGGDLPATSADLDRTIAAVKSARQQAGVTASEVVLTSTRQYLSTKRAEPLIQELEAAFANGQMQQLLDKLPPAQRDQLRPLVNGPDGKISGEALLRQMRGAFANPGMNPDLARQIGASLKALTGLIHKANEPGATPAALAEFGRQPLDGNLPLPGSSFDMLSDMKFMQDSMRDLRATIGQDAIRESSDRLVGDARRIMDELSQKNPGQPVDRKVLYGKIRESINTLKSESLNQSLLAGLESFGEPAASAQQGPSLTEGLYGNPLMQNALQNVFGRANQALLSNPGIKPTLDRLAAANPAALDELKGLLESAGSNPASLIQDMRALLTKHLPPADAQLLQASLVSEIHKSLSQSISQAEKTLNNYSRTDTRKAQSDMIDTLKAYQALLGPSQGLEAAGTTVQNTASDTVKGISQGAGELLAAILPEGVKPKDMFYKIFPSMLQGEPTDRQLLEDLSSFLELDRGDLARKLGVPKLSDEQYMAIQLAAGSLATARATQDPHRGPVAAALAHLVKDVTAHPELLHSGHKRQQLKDLLQQAGEVRNANDCEGFLKRLGGLDPDAAKAGSDLLVSRRTLNANLQAARNLGQTTPVTPSGAKNQPAKDVKAPPTLTGQPAQPVIGPNPAQTVEGDRPADKLDDKGSKPASSNPSFAGEMVGGLATGLHLSDADLPPSAVKDPATGMPHFAIKTVEIPPELEARLFNAGTHALSNALDTYAGMPPDEQNRIRTNSPISRFATKLVEQTRHYEQTVHTESQRSSTLLEEYKGRLKMYIFISNQFAEILSKNPQLLQEMMRTAMDKLMANFRSPDQEVAILKAQADELAKQMLAPAPTPDMQLKLSNAVMDYLSGIRNQPPQVQQLALADLAQKMITSAIHSFYDKAAQESNKRQFQSLEAMAARMHEQIDAELRKTLAEQHADGAEARRQHRALDPGLSQGLKHQLENMLTEAQQMHPPMLTDFKRHQILQALFDANPANDAQGILALAGPRAQ